MINENLTPRRLICYARIFLHGGAGRCATRIIKQLASKIAEKKYESYSFCAALSYASEGTVVANGRLTLVVLAVTWCGRGD